MPPKTAGKRKRAPDEYEEKVRKLKAKIALLNELRTTSKEAVRSVEQRLDQSDAEIRGLKEEKERLEGSVRKLQETIEKLERDLARSRAKVVQVTAAGRAGAPPGRNGVATATAGVVGTGHLLSQKRDKNARSMVLSERATARMEADEVERALANLSEVPKFDQIEPLFNEWKRRSSSLRSAPIAALVRLEQQTLCNAGRRCGRECSETLVVDGGAGGGAGLVQALVRLWLHDYLCLGIGSAAKRKRAAAPTWTTLVSTAAKVWPEAFPSSSPSSSPNSGTTGAVLLARALLSASTKESAESSPQWLGEALRRACLERTDNDWAWIDAEQAAAALCVVASQRGAAWTLESVVSLINAALEENDGGEGPVTVSCVRLLGRIARACGVVEIWSEAGSDEEVKSKSSDNSGGGSTGGGRLTNGTGGEGKGSGNEKGQVTGRWHEVYARLLHVAQTSASPPAVKQAAVWAAAEMMMPSA